MKKLYVVIAVTWAALFGGGAMAAVIDCPASPSGGQYYLELTAPASITATCWDWGTTGDNGNITPTPTSDPVTLNDAVFQVPLGTSTTDRFGSWLTGTSSGVTSGTLTMTIDATGPLYLLFKSGGGQNDPWWYAYQLSGLVSGETFDWQILTTCVPSAPGVHPPVNCTINGMSHIGLYNGTPTDSDSDSDTDSDVPEPGTLALLGLGLMGLGAARRRKV